MVTVPVALALALLIWPPRLRRPPRSVAPDAPRRPGWVDCGLRRVRPLPVAAAVGGLLLPVAGLASAVAGAGAGWTLLTLVGRALRDRRRSRDRADLAAALGMLARELRAGAVPGQALLTTAGSRTGAARAALEHIAAVGLRTGPPPPPVSTAVADVVAHRLAVCWSVSQRHGLPLARLVDALRADLQADVERSELRASEAAGPRLSGHLLAALPALGLLLGAGMGADPIRVLTGTTAGQLLLLGGVLLTCAGLLWTDRLVAGPGQR